MRVRNNGVYLSGEFHEKQSAERAILELKENGFGADDLAVFSDEPVEFRRGVLDRPSHMSFISVTGAITMCLLVIGFVYYTQVDYPLVTGGMPIFSGWATGVVFYEMTMLGAILTTFGWFLWESGLLRRGPKPPAPAVQPDVIALRIRCGNDKTDAVRRVLEDAGASRVEALGDRR